MSNCKFRVVNKHRSRKTELLLLSFIVLLVSCNKTIANFTLFLIIFLPIIKKKNISKHIKRILVLLYQKTRIFPLPENKNIPSFPIP